MSISVKSFCKDKGFVSVAKCVRVNSNGYPYITFINSLNEAENVYFSKKASQDVTEGELVDMNFLKKFEVFETTNAQGETRMKLGYPLDGENSPRVTLSWDDEEEEVVLSNAKPEPALEERM